MSLFLLLMNRELKFTNVSKDVATMLIYSEIGEMGVNGAAFASEMQYLNECYGDIASRLQMPHH